MNALANMHCEPCTRQSKALSMAEQQGMLEQLPQWQLLQVEPPQLQRQFSFTNFVQAMQFAQQLSDCAEHYNHHPKLTIEWGQCTVNWWTHSIAGLHQNDFILAAKTEAIYAELTT